MIDPGLIVPAALLLLILGAGAAGAVALWRHPPHEEEA